MPNGSQNEELKDDARYQDSSLICDVVMKGGITSGITYPGAVCEIARTYRLRNVGGTSAGAIAAAAAAASEVGRSVPGAGFGRLAQLPKRLSANSPGRTESVLFNLFQPSSGTRPLFRALVAVLKSKEGARGQEARVASLARKIVKFARAIIHFVRTIVFAIVAAAPLAALAGAAFGVGTLVLLLVAGVGGSEGETTRRPSASGSAGS